MGLFGLLDGQELIARQINAIKDVPSKGLKEFSPNNSWLERKQIENQLDEKFHFIKASRIEKSNNVSQAEWIPQTKKAKLTKKIGNFWETLGHHQDNEDWLLPEEALFLLENSELQLFYDNVSMSIEDCYKLVFDDSGCSLDEYRVFSYLSRAGLKAIRHSPSVSVTRYEKQVKLDSIVQLQKRLPPELSIREITIIDDDISIIEYEPKKLLRSASNTDKPNTERMDAEAIVIESDDEEIKEIDIDSDSDVVCISSPSVEVDVNSRQWYPTIKKCLQMTMEKVIDLCDDEIEVIDSKSNIRNRLDLIRSSKADILSRIPNAKKEINLFTVADKRLLPSNITTQFSEYKLSLNVRDEEFREVSDYSRESPFSMMNFNEFNNSGMNQQLIHANPILAKAHEMQTMAVNMMQSAVALMSVMSVGSQNPNELWDLCRNGTSGMMPYNPRPALPYQFRHAGPPRRPRPFNYRYQRRRYPYPRRPWTDRRQHYQPSGINNHSNTQEVVELSDEDDIGIDGSSDNNHPGEETRGKRKTNESLDANNKRVKIESDLDKDGSSDGSSIICEESTENVKKEPEEIVNVKNEPRESISERGNSQIKSEVENVQIVENSRIKTEVIVTKESSVQIKEESNATEPLKTNSNPHSLLIKTENDSLNKNSVESEKVVSKEINCNSEVGVNAVNAKDQVHREPNTDEKHSSQLEPQKTVNSTPTNIQNSSKGTQNSSGESSCPQDTTDISNEVNQTANNILDQRGVVNDSDEKDMSQSESNSTSSNTIHDGGPGCSKTPSDVNNKETQSSKTNEEPEKLSSWEQYKSIPEGYIEEDDSLMKFDQCNSYSDVLSSLKIFKQIDVNRVTKKFKISFDVYLPDSTFKKSLKVLPNFRVIVLKSSDELPTSYEVEGLKIEYQDNIPFLFSVVFHETIGFYMYDTIMLNTLND